jgi:pSer/pThr/pTyr-binding forkhead associated (FHA) protein
MENRDLPIAFFVIGGSKIFPIDKQVIQIGRSRENDIILDYPQISRKHAELRFNQGYFEISDLDSMGGTFVNGEMISRKKLDKGDVVTLVNLHLVFGQDEIPDSATTIEYHKPEDSLIAEQDTKSFKNDSSKSEPKKKSGSY